MTSTVKEPGTVIVREPQVPSDAENSDAENDTVLTVSIDLIIGVLV
jgi:hypothetical protein